MYLTAKRSECMLKWWDQRCHHGCDIGARIACYHIKPEVGGMRKMEVHQVMAIHQTGGIQGHSSLECYTHQAPLSNISRANRVGYEEDLSKLAMIC